MAIMRGRGSKFQSRIPLFRLFIAVLLLTTVEELSVQSAPSSNDENRTRDSGSGKVIILESSKTFPTDDPPPLEVEDPCEAFYYEYIDAAGNFTHCELHHAAPFRLCSTCVEQYAVVCAVFDDLINLPRLKKCKVQYTKADRVQIIPTMQKNIEAVWKTSDCEGCAENLHVDKHTKAVNYTIPQDISHFWELYGNLSDCLNFSLTDINFKWTGRISNTSFLCQNCTDKYAKLNAHYNRVADEKDGNVCMDMVDMMNHTRLIWSSHLNCSHRSGDSGPVIAIACVVASTPLFFYVSVKITGRVRQKKIFKQKRLDASQNTIGSTSQSFSVGGNSGTYPRHRLRNVL